MKLFADKFIQTLLFNLVTIAAIIVGVSQFIIRAWNDNDCSAKVRQFVIKTLQVINQLTGEIYQSMNHDVPVVKVSTKRAKRS